MADFLTDHGALVAVICALLAVAYGVVTTRSLLALSPGNEVMQRLSAAVQEGAQAYLRRQYTTIGAVGVVLFIALIPLQNIEVAIGFAIGGLASAAAGFIGMNVSVRSNARVAEAARGGIGPALERRLPRRRRDRHARRRPRPAGRRRLLRHPHVALQRRAPRRPWTR